MRRVAAILPLEPVTGSRWLYRIGLKPLRARGGWRRDRASLGYYEAGDRETLFRHRSGVVERVWPRNPDPPGMGYPRDFLVYYEEVPDPPEPEEDSVEYPANPWATESREVLDKR